MNWIAGYKQHYKALIFLGLPIVIGQVGVIILGFADTLMIGHHSTEELGAASFVNNVFTLCIIFTLTKVSLSANNLCASCKSLIILSKTTEVGK